ERVGAGRHGDGDADRRFLVVEAQELVGLRAKLDAGYVAQPQRRAVRIAAHEDLAELLRRLQTGLRADGGVEPLALDRRRAAELADGDLLVLRPHRGGNVGWRQG